MARAYSDDLRRKVQEAHAAGKGSQRALAERFGVSRSWVEKIFRQRRSSGLMERVEQRHGPRSRMTAEAERHLREQLRIDSDLTLAELQQRLWAGERVRLSVAQLCRVLKRLDLRLKKSRSTRRSKTAKPTVSAAGSGKKR